MDRLKERQEAIHFTFRYQYEGRVPITSPTWQDLEDRIHTFFEILDTLIAKSKRQKDFHLDWSSDVECKQVLYELLRNCVLEHTFPVCQNFSASCLCWLQKVFNIERDSSPISQPNAELTSDHKYVFKTYYLDTETRVTCMEEVKKMSNEEATTGMVTWQAAPALLSYATGQDIFKQFQKVLELGSGAGLLGLGLLQSIGVDTYTFTDVSAQVLNILNANVIINDSEKRQSCTDLEKWLTEGPPKKFNSKDVALSDQITIQRKDPQQDIYIRHLDWLNTSDEVLQSLEFDVIVGSDLTYTPSMLLPLAQLIKRLLNLKEKSCQAYIACTQRGVRESIAAFLQHVLDVGLRYSLASQLIDASSCISVSHEPLHKVFIYKIYL